MREFRWVFGWFSGLLMAVIFGMLFRPDTNTALVVGFVFSAGGAIAVTLLTSGRDYDGDT